MSFKLYLPAASDDKDRLSHNWEDEELEEHLALCRYQTTAGVFESLPKNGRILEVGCGLGRWVIHLRRKGHRVIGLDKDYGALKRAREYDRQSPVVRSDVLTMPLQNQSVDAVMCTGLVEHFEEGPNEAIREMRRVLKPDGTLLLGSPYNSLFRRMLVNPAMAVLTPAMRLALWLLRSRYRLAFAEYRFSKTEMHDMLLRNGFRVLGTYPDDLEYPRSIGLYVDYVNCLGQSRFFRPRGGKWELGPLGGALHRLFNFISPWFACGGILCVAKKVEDQRGNECGGVNVS